jgi:hypothetical protein
MLYGLRESLQAENAYVISRILSIINVVLLTDSSFRSN